uniref:Uncharacterized protein n=1 Tax=Rhizophora mucronata TaxID=61149 RepID=A0A2P2Q2G1_RHIMU
MEQYKKLVFLDKLLIKFKIKIKITLNNEINMTSHKMMITL